MTHTWTPYPSKLPYEALTGHKDALVRTRPIDRGYLWQYGKKYGFAETVEAAREWVEALAEHYSIPPAKRWIQL